MGSSLADLRQDADKAAGSLRDAEAKLAVARRQLADASRAYHLCILSATADPPPAQAQPSAAQGKAKGHAAISDPVGEQRARLDRALEEYATVARSLGLTAPAA